MTYLKKFSLIIALLLIIIGGLNWFVDPFGMYWSPTISNINKIKPEASNRVRISKPYRVEQIKPDVLLMGNSRVEMGLSPYHPAFKGKKVYNLGLAGATLHSQIDHIYHAIQTSPNLETIVFGLDFFDFLVTPTGNETNATKTSYGHRVFSAKGFQHAKKRYTERLALVYSVDALISSLFTMSQQYSMVDSIGPFGLNSAQAYVKILESEGKKPLFKQKLNFVKEKLSQKPWQLTSNEGTPISPKFEKLLELIRVAESKNITLHLFINPYHYSYLHAIDQQGYFDLYLQWKKTLADVVRDHKSQQISLWDFSGFNQYTLEPEKLMLQHQKMQWYWEPAHYNVLLGNVLIKSIFSGDTSDFGQRLDNKALTPNFESEIQALKNSSHHWHQLLEQL
ncbi:hypothetical protein Q4489_00690 [Thalassotalea sp. 1_MG-2023]|uniref:hypothetical protein n=1 Tax=Thalassotalea sp. 1_MG-2023 TaxID=3062680 RepID=UPI0026E3EA67|nr:hypothetical protein [Thalassotalea sp. 1_MG-2023]MDO6425505.1 hypothetical protein [Thalassotalea sp. 1_MG-2023]